MKNLSILDPKKRIAIILIKLIEVFGYLDKKSNLLSFTLKRNDLANMANTTYETVIRALSYLSENGLIELVGKKNSIKNEKKLREFAEV